ncbi:MAG TPA: alkaline phosphatase family protein [Steroidobacteraceae bacterium]
MSRPIAPTARLVTGLLLALLGAARADAAPSAPVSTAAARIRHVLVIVLENKSFDNTFGDSTQDPYLRNTLVPMGALLTQYYGTGHVSLDNYISMISGQAPTPDTEEDCLPGLNAGATNYNDVVQTGTTPDGQVIASGGCIYPAGVKTLADQFSAKGLRWRGYMQDMGNDPAREPKVCGHPPIGIGTDRASAAEAPSSAVPSGDAYATRHNPFMYFHSIIDSSSCATNVVNLEQLSADLADIARTPNFAFITPNLCDDGHDGSGTGAEGTTCANGKPGGLTSADAFLKRWVPIILASPAYQRDGLLIITFDESNYTQSVHDNPSTGQTIIDITFTGSTCCGQLPGPNIRANRPGRLKVVNTATKVVNIVFDGYGGDRIGAVLLSPFVMPGSRSSVAYNHYSLLKSLEDIFGLGTHLGYAADNPRTGYHLDTIGEDVSVFKTR